MIRLPWCRIENVRSAGFYRSMMEGKHEWWGLDGRCGREPQLAHSWSDKSIRAWKNDGTEKRMAQAWWKPDRAVKRHLQTSQKSGINELMRCMDNKYKFIPRLVFQLEETVLLGSTYSVENQLDKTTFWSWKPFAAS